ncbi:unnamed protein product [Acanthoscelides obtectus]|uniref:Uncharacterized protein n=1 Tax=Acanthoscelides obtectus TaxID=200917 RepID=A0A9P0Q5R0_ACAOB|nr:unnamed protein product [Acanthoscelides obtectus]CAK1621040.1 hypothetical protein AOBTE_LOCUS717 [Acanthoscelides obtectus]
MIYDIKPFIKNLEFWEQNQAFSCFKDFNEIAIMAQFAVSPFMEIDIQQFATSVTQNFSEDIAAIDICLEYKMYLTSSK